MQILYFNSVKISLPIFSPICRFFPIFSRFLPIFSPFLPMFVDFSRFLPSFRDVRFFEKIAIFSCRKIGSQKKSRFFGISPKNRRFFPLCFNQSTGTGHDFNAIIMEQLKLFSIYCSTHILNILMPIDTILSI